MLYHTVLYTLFFFSAISACFSNLKQATWSFFCDKQYNVHGSAENVRIIAWSAPALISMILKPSACVIVYSWSPFYHRTSGNVLWYSALEYWQDILSVLGVTQWCLPHGLFVVPLDIKPEHCLLCGRADCPSIWELPCLKQCLGGWFIHLKKNPCRWQDSWFCSWALH